MKKLLLLCAHTPSLDPRIAWVANTASKYYDVTVAGITTDPGEVDQPRGDYKVDLLYYYDFKNTLKTLWKKDKKTFLHFLFQTAPYSLVMVPYIAGRIWKKRRQAARGVEKLETAEGRKKWGERMKMFSWLWFNFQNAYLNYLIYFLDEGRQDCDVVLCADLNTLKSGWWYKKRFGAKLIYDAHEFFAYAFADSLQSQINFCLRYERKLIGHTDAAFTVNPHIARVMKEELGCETTFLSVPNCASLEPVSRYDDDIVRLADGRKVFLFQGNFMPERGVEELLDAWGRIDPAKAVLFLRGLDSVYKDDMIQKAAKLGLLDKSVFFLPPVDEDDLIAAARNADVGIIPYKGTLINNKYCCPNKLSQYMQAGLALLANGTVFVKEQIEKYGCGLVYEADDVATIVECINRLCDEDGLLNRYKEKSRTAAVTDYNWDVQCKPMDDVLRVFAQK